MGSTERTTPPPPPGDDFYAATVVRQAPDEIIRALRSDAPADDSAHAGLQASPIPREFRAIERRSAESPNARRIFPFFVGSLVLFVISLFVAFASMLAR